MNEEPKSSEWLWPPAGHWMAASGFALLLPMALIASAAMNAIGWLAQNPWRGFSVGLAVAMAGAALIFYAKLPLYRERRFCTFGSRALPQERRCAYRWAYGFVAVGCGLFLLLLLP